MEFTTFCSKTDPSKRRPYLSDALYFRNVEELSVETRDYFLRWPVMRSVAVGIDVIDTVALATVTLDNN